MTISLYSHDFKDCQLATGQSGDTFWITMYLGDTVIDFFVTKDNVEKITELGAKLIETATTVKRGELVGVETLAAARHAVAKTNPSPDMITDFGMVEHKTYVPDEDDIPF